jgi:hypothetical protein
VRYLALIGHLLTPFPAGPTSALTPTLHTSVGQSSPPPLPQAAPVRPVHFIASSFPHFSWLQASGVTKKSWNDYRLEVMASARTALNIVEKALDGVPVPGLKAAVGAASEIVKARQVRDVPILSSVLWSSSQTSIENEEAISDIVKMVGNTQKDLLASITSAFDPSLATSPEVKKRIDELFRLVSRCMYDRITHIFQWNEWNPDVCGTKFEIEQECC